MEQRTPIWAAVVGVAGRFSREEFLLGFGSGLGKGKRGSQKYPTYGGWRHWRHTTGRAFSGVPGVWGVRLQPLGSSVGFGAGTRMAGRENRASSGPKLLVMRDLRINEVPVSGEHRPSTIQHPGPSLQRLPRRQRLGLLDRDDVQWVEHVHQATFVVPNHSASGSGGDGQRRGGGPGSSEMSWRRMSPTRGLLLADSKRYGSV